MTVHADTQALRERVAERVRLAQEESGFASVEDAARAVGVSLRLYQKWRAADAMPSLPNLKRLERTFGKNVAWFFEEGEAS